MATVVTKGGFKFLRRNSSLKENAAEKSSVGETSFAGDDNDFQMPSHSQRPTPTQKATSRMFQPPMKSSKKKTEKQPSIKDFAFKSQENSPKRTNDVLDPVVEASSGTKVETVVGDRPVAQVKTQQSPVESYLLITAAETSSPIPRKTFEKNVSSDQRSIDPFDDEDIFSTVIETQFTADAPGSVDFQLRRDGFPDKANSGDHASSFQNELDDFVADDMEIPGDDEENDLFISQRVALTDEGEGESSPPLDLNGLDPDLERLVRGIDKTYKVSTSTAEPEGESDIAYFDERSNSPFIDDPSQNVSANCANGKKPLFKSKEISVKKPSSVEKCFHSSGSADGPSNVSKVDLLAKYVESLEAIAVAVEETENAQIPSMKIELNKMRALRKRLGGKSVRAVISDLVGVVSASATDRSYSLNETSSVTGRRSSQQPRSQIATTSSTTFPDLSSRSWADDIFDNEVSTPVFPKDSRKSSSKYSPKKPIRIDLTLNSTQSSTPEDVAKEKQKKSAPLLSVPTPGRINNQQSHSTSNSSSTLPYVAPETPKDDGPEFNRENYPHSTRLRNIFKNTFGLKTFRKNQLEAINACLLGHDTFVLMPTGGGKSLCYQLPALVQDGVTVVVSPLKSLIQDQVDRLRENSIKAEFLSSDLTQSKTDEVFHHLQLRSIEIKLLYITPEKLSSSGRLSSCLQNLYRRKLLTMFVIDEAHCVSQWGHDFRPDYKKLCSLREQYQDTPIMALTATATMRVRTDVLHQLRIKGAKQFVQSFNRGNLRYKVFEKKPKLITDQIIERIKSDFNRKSGIVYCLSRKECDTVAKALRSAGIKAEPYHAGLTDNQRSSAQRRWVRDETLVVCATIAFGMGIDKADVRYVIHYSLPKSIEGYYQESGRAGRDGDEATCILYYSYQDVIRMRRIIEMDNPNKEAIKIHINNLYRMVAYANDTVDCRRVIQLQYFGENNFTSHFCKKVGPACDNCSNSVNCVVMDATQIAKNILSAVKRMCETGRGYNAGKFTLAYLADVVKGANTQRIEQSGHKSDQFAFALLKDWKKNDVERLLRHLVINQYLKENVTITVHDTAVAYVACGPKAGPLFDSSGLEIVSFSLRGSAHLGAKSSDSSVQIRDKNEDLRLECYEQLVKLVKDLSQEHNKTSYALIYNNETLREMSRKLPVDEGDFRKITAVTDMKIRTYGCERFLDITREFASQITVRQIEAQDREERSQNEFQESDFVSDEEDDLENFGSTSRHFSPGSYRGRGGKFFKRGSKRGGYKRKRTGGSSQGYQSGKRQKRGGTTTSSRRGRGGTSSTSSDVWLSTSKAGGVAPKKSGSVGLMSAPVPQTRRPDLGF